MSMLSKLGYPSINENTNEQNISNIRNYLYEMSDNMNYYMNQLQGQIDAINEQIASLTGKGED